MKKFVLGEHEFNKEIGKLIVKWRTKKGLYQRDLARTLDISCQQLSRYELGRCGLSVFKLVTILEEFEIPIDKVYRRIVYLRKDVKIDSDD